MDTKSGKITVLTMFLSIFVIFLGVLLDVGSGGNIPTASADSATTSVRVVNSPPSWLVNAEESTESSTSTPTNASTTISWTGTAVDGNGEDFYLIVCATSTPPTPTDNAAPSCAAGAFQYAVSVATTDSTQATATYTARDIDQESNDWYAFVCDGNDGGSACNATYTQGSGVTASPFVVNHRPDFDGFWDESGATPGSVATWHATSSDPDFIRGGDTVRLIVCKDTDYIPATQECGVAGYYGSSTPAVTLNPTATSTLASVLQDKNYTSYGYVVDNFGLTSGGSITGTDSELTVDNVAPTILASGITVASGTTIILDTESGETTGIELEVLISDSNSCLADGGGDEITSLAANVFRSGVGSTSCLVAGDYDPNNCYPEAVGAATWNLSCSQRAGSCLGANDPEAIWDCTFPLWHVADPVNGNASETYYWDEFWVATASAFDEVASSTWVEGDTGEWLQPLLAYNVATTSIPYGVLEPGFGNTTTVATTTFEVTGNMGFDENVYGTDMCTTYSASTPCPVSGTSTIPVLRQRYATSTVLYGAATPLSAVPVEVEINALKSTSTSSPATADTTWGIFVPGTISLSGDYLGENTIIGVAGEPGEWY